MSPMIGQSLGFVPAAGMPSAMVPHTVNVTRHPQVSLQQYQQVAWVPRSRAWKQTSYFGGVPGSAFVQREGVAQARMGTVGGSGGEESLSSGLRMSAISPETARIGIAVFGFLIGGGGIGAFLKSGSKPSLISGVVSAILLGIAYAKDNVTAALVISCLLSVVFTGRLIKTKKFIPAGLLLIICICAAIFFTTSLYA